jgi:MYXO-CTERM domain-containing protein
VSWWPPAPGWWLLAALALLALAALAGWQIRRRRHRLHRELAAALDGLRALPASEQAERVPRELSVLLRRAALTLEPRAEVAGLTGERWLDRLDALAGGRFFATPEGRTLIEAPYRPAGAVTAEDAARLLDVGAAWLAALPAQGRRP